MRRFIREIQSPSQLTVLRASCGYSSVLPLNAHIDLVHVGEDGMQPELVFDRSFSLMQQCDPCVSQLSPAFADEAVAAAWDDADLQPPGPVV